MKTTLGNLKRLIKEASTQPKTNRPNTLFKVSFEYRDDMGKPTVSEVLEVVDEIRTKFGNVPFSVKYRDYMTGGMTNVDDIDDAYVSDLLNTHKDGFIWGAFVIVEPSSFNAEVVQRWCVSMTRKHSQFWFGVARIDAPR